MLFLPLLLKKTTVSIFEDDLAGNALLDPSSQRGLFSQKPENRFETIFLKLNESIMERYARTVDTKQKKCRQFIKKQCLCTEVSTEPIEFLHLLDTIRIVYF